MKLKEIREAAGFSQKQLSDISGVSTAAISLIEKKDRDPRVSTAMKLANALELKVEELCGEKIPEGNGWIESRGALLKLKQKLSKIRELTDIQG